MKATYISTPSLDCDPAISIGPSAPQLEERLGANRVGAPEHWPRRGSRRLALSGHSEPGSSRVSRS
jgi:hypothetical protein